MNKLTLQVNGTLAVNILPSPDHEFLMTTYEVAQGYGVNSITIQRHLTGNPDEFIEGKHFVKGVQIMNTLKGTNLQPHQTFWTKRGIVRLGFFIKSDLARQFRDWAEDLVIFASNNNIHQHLEERVSELENTILALTRRFAPKLESIGIGGNELSQMVKTDASEVAALAQTNYYTPTEVMQLARAAGWLRLINEFGVKQARQMGFASIEILRSQIFRCILNEQGAQPLPLIRFKKGTISHLRVLCNNALQYRRQGIKCLIHAGMGNNNRMKNS